MNLIHASENALALYRNTIQIKSKMPAAKRGLTDGDYRKLADFRYGLRRFLDFSAHAALSEGLTPQQHQALLAVRGNATPPSSVGYLAKRLRIRPNTAAELAQRLEQAGLITRSENGKDRRTMDLELTSEGKRRLDALTLVHRRELSQLRPVVLELLESLEEESE